MSKIKNGGLDQYGAGLFEQQQFGTASVEGVKISISFGRWRRKMWHSSVSKSNNVHGGNVCEIRDGGDCVCDVDEMNKFVRVIYAWLTGC